MLSFRLLSAGSTVAPLVVAVALIATPGALRQTPARVRGTITAKDDRSIALKNQGERTFTLTRERTRRMPTYFHPGLDEIKIGEMD